MAQREGYLLLVGQSGNVVEQQPQLLLAHIARLPEQQQVAFTLRHEQELSYEEIAAVLGTTVAAVESLLFRARQTLRKHVQPSFRHV